VKRAGEFVDVFREARLRRYRGHRRRRLRDLPIERHHVLEHVRQG